MGDLEQRAIIRTATWQAAGLGAMLGPGIDAISLVGIWAVGYVRKLRDARLDVDEDKAKGAVAGLIAGASQWVSSGVVAKGVLALFASAALAATGIGLALLPVAILGTNSLINALYTYKFLTTTSRVVRETTRIEGTMFEMISSLFLTEIADVFGLFGSLADMFKLLASG